MALSPGDRLGPYDVIAAIGAGGMGEVYKARDTRLDRSVAIKVLPEHIAKREDLRARFEREARAVASLNHPNICTLFDIGNQDGVGGFMVMELIEGESLAQRVEKGPIPLDQALKIATQIADALDRAHRAGVTHRDVKPQNIMLTRDGVKVLDFGLAKSQAKPGPAGETLTAVLTTEGAIIGTPQYMAPEQFAGKEADARSDIWAFGAVLYEMITGRKAFHGSNYQSLVGAILAMDPAPMAMQPFTPAWLERLVRRCLQKDTDDRYQAMRDLVIDLKSPPEPETSPAAPALRRPLPWILAGTAAALLAALAFVHFREVPPVPSPTVRWELAATEIVQFFALSPDGRHLASLRTENGVRRIELRALHSGESKVLPDTDGYLYPFWSADSRNIGFFADGKLKRIAVGGARAQVICDAPNPRGGAWNREDIILFAPDISGPLFRVPAAGGAPVPVTSPAPKISHRYAEFIDGGSKFLFTDPRGLGLMVGDLQGTPPVSILPKSFTSAAYVPVAGNTGVLLFREDEALLAQSFDPKELRLSGEPVMVADQVGVGGQIGHGAFSASRNGILVYRKGTRNPERQLVWLTRTGARLAAVGAPGPIQGFSLSPDAKRIAMSIRPSEAAQNVWILDLGTGVFSRFAGGDGPIWSRDGAHLLYAGQTEMSFDIPVFRRPAGGGTEERVVHSGPNTHPADISPDGKFLAYTATGEKSNDDILLVPLDGYHKPVPFLQTAAAESHPQFSHDGQWLVYQSNESGSPEIWAQPVPPTGAKIQISTAGGRQPRWRRDGKDLFYISPAGQLMAVPVTAGKSLERGAPSELLGGLQFSATLVLRGFTY